MVEGDQAEAVRNTGYTPGPWRVERQFSNGCEIVPRIVCQPDADRKCGWIADLVGAPYLGHQSTLANARLIAAAPELLEALQQLAWHVQHDMGTTVENPYLIAANAAIAKATTSPRG